MFTTLLATLGGFFGKYWITILKILIPVVLVLGAAWWVYSKGKDAQSVADQKTISTAQKERDDAKASLAAYVSSYNSWKKTSDTEAADAKKTSDGIVASLKTQLATAQATAQKIKIVTHEVTKYVTAKQDADTPISVGFVQLYNFAVENGSGPSAFGIPSPAGGSFDAPSGVKLSTVASVNVYNTAVCLSYQSEVVAWRSWYVQQKKNYDDVQATIQAAQPTPPPAPVAPVPKTP